MNQVESRPLRYFVAVARELNFARAARRLGIAPPALSRSIAQLESHLGVTLLERTTRQVTLTDAGQVLLDQAQTALAALDAAVRQARRAADPGRRLVVAFKADLDDELLKNTITAYDREQPAMPIDVVVGGWDEQLPLLRDGSADVALTYAPFDDRGLDSEVLLEEPEFVALPTGHPLASQPVLRVAELEVGSVAARFVRPQITYRPVLDTAPRALHVVWSRSSSSLATAAFVRIIAGLACARRTTADHPVAPVSPAMAT